MSDSPSVIVREWLLDLQQRICTRFEGEEPAGSFVPDSWQYDSGGGGISRVLEGGDTIEKGGVNFSHIVGDSLPPTASVRHPELAGRPFEAMGVSVVIHPRNPHVPTSHMNVRFFSTRDEGKSPVWWFGGGFDLTPYYPVDEDIVHWHQCAFDACSSFGDDTYAQYKKTCDEYFYLKHRGETRGVGGLFFDDLNEPDFESCFEFWRGVGDAYIKAYSPILAKRKDTPFGEREKAFQSYRRGRYVEFNLVFDRGTLFGLQSGGRTESILMSMPPVAHWKYQWQAEPGSAEEALVRDYLKPRDWLGLQ